MNYYVFADGASKGNPGKASVGAVCFADVIPNLTEFKQGFEPVFAISECIGHKTNNEAEYLAIIMALKKLAEANITRAKIFMDSELVVKQVNGQYKVKKDTLQILCAQVKELTRGREFVFAHVPREKNSIADYLANKAFA